MQLDPQKGFTFFAIFLLAGTGPWDRYTQHIIPSVAIADSHVVSLQKAEPSICRDEQDLDGLGRGFGRPSKATHSDDFSCNTARRHGAWMLFRLGQLLYNWTMLAFPCKGCGMQLHKCPLAMLRSFSCLCALENDVTHLRAPLYFSVCCMRSHSVHFLCEPRV